MPDPTSPDINALAMEIMDAARASSVPPAVRFQTVVARLRTFADAQPLLAEGDLIEFYKQRMAEHRNNCIAHRERAEALEAQCGRLREALRPFAEYADVLDRFSLLDETSLVAVGSVRPTAGDCRKAREALRGCTGAGDNADG